MLKNIKFTGKIVSEPTYSDNLEATFLFEFNRRCITATGDWEHRREVAEVVVSNASKLKEQIRFDSRLVIQGDLSLTQMFLNTTHTPVLRLTVNRENDLHFISYFGTQPKIEV